MVQRLVIASTQLIDLSTVNLTAEQRHYLLSVLRLRRGDRLILLDGCGQGWLAALNETEATTLTATLLEPYCCQTELSLSVNLVAALPKNGFDEVVRSCTELGVKTIIPVISERTVLKPSPNKLVRWRKIAMEAAEQSERAIVPTIQEPITFASYLKLTTPSAVNPYYLCGARAKSLHLLDALATSFQGTLPTEISLLIGPEGGWTEGEIDRAIAQQMTVVSLGSQILRAVTASVTALSLVNGYLSLRERGTGRQGERETKGQLELC
jgi:16S rRNA (uracil1498-N3)-methyltransferase